MKKYIYMLIAVIATAYVTSCDTENPLEDLGGETGAFASWIKSPSGDLLTSDPSSAIDWEFELIDENNGNNVKSVTLSVTDGTNSGSFPAITSFTTNDNGRQGASGSFDLNDVVSVLGVGAATIEEGAAFDFSFAVEKVDGSVWGQANAGSSSGYDPANPFTLSTGMETVSVTSFVIDSMRLSSSGIDTVTIGFANQFTTALSVMPTITRTSVSGNTDDMIGMLKAIKDEDGVDSVYYFSYQPGAAAEDTISFTFTGGSALASGYVMVDTLFKAVYTVDNVDPTILTNASSLKRGSGLDTLGYNFNVVFSESLGEISLMANFTGVDDDGDDDIDEAGEGVPVTVATSGDVMDFTYDWTGSADGEVTLTLMVKDLAGNPLSLGTTVLTTDD